MHLILHLYNIYIRNIYTYAINSYKVSIKKLNLYIVSSNPNNYSLIVFTTTKKDYPGYDGIKEPGKVIFSRQPAWVCAICHFLSAPGFCALEMLLPGSQLSRKLAKAVPLNDKFKQLPGSGILAGVFGFFFSCARFGRLLFW